MDTLTFNQMSMLNRIRQAENPYELMKLVRERATYEYASDKTRKRWTKAIEMRNDELSKIDKKHKSETIGKTNKKPTDNDG